MPEGVLQRPFNGQAVTRFLRRIPSAWTCAWGSEFISILITLRCKDTHGIRKYFQLSLILTPDDIQKEADEKYNNVFNDHEYMGVCNVSSCLER